MRNSGIVAVGHILSSAKDQKETLKALRKMVALMLANISGEMLHASAFALFDKFMSVSKANLENFAVLAMGILMKHGSDELEYQLKVELMVWDIVKHLYDKYKINDSLLFQLFGIFNRFCDPREIPLTLSNKAAVFLFQKLDIPPSIATCQETWDFTQLLIAIQSCIGPSMESKIQRLHTKIVKNLLMEGKIRVKIAQENGNFIHWASSLTSTPLPPKLIQINHRHLIVYKNESEIMYKIPLFEAVARVKKSNNLIFKKSACTVVILAKEVVAGSNRSTTIELSFDPFKDEYEMYKWIEAVSQAADFTRQGSDPLTLIYQSHDIRPSYFKYGGHVSKAFSQVDPLAKSTLDMRDVAQHQPPVKRRSSAPNLEAAANEDSFSDSGVSSGSNA